MNESERDNQMISLRKQAFDLMNLKEVQPEQREVLVQYIKMVLEDAKRLPNEQLYGVQGRDIAHGINGVIGVQDWLSNEGGDTKNTELGISQIFDHSGPLELEPHQNGYSRQEIEDKWQLLFEAGDKLK